MQRELEGSEERRVRVHTLQGSVEGSLQTNSGISTTHYLNVAAATHRFLPLRPPLTCSQDWVFDDATLAVAMDSILFVTEMSKYEPRPGDPQKAAQFQRVPVRLRLAGFVVDGHVYVPKGTNPLHRLNQDRHPFFALTVVSVMGPREQFATSYLAAHRRHVAAIQQILGELEPPRKIDTLEHARS
jgi:hypothetical protein